MKKCVADAFSGKGGVAHAVRELGFAAREFEIEQGYDLLLRRNQEQIFSEVRGGGISAVMMAPPCTSLSRARRVRLRSKELPWGLQFLSAKEQDQVKHGNLCVRFCLRLMRLCLKYDVPFILENPQTSFLWDLPEIEALVNKSDCYVRVLDFCQFGTKWKKPTRFLFGGIPWSDSEPLQRRCEARGGRCSRTGENT